VRTVLVCVRTQVAAQTVAAAAARLGVAHAVRTAVTMVEALARLSEQPADLVLADPSLSRPDSAEFSRRGRTRCAALFAQAGSKSLTTATSRR